MTDTQTAWLQEVKTLRELQVNGDRSLTTEQAINTAVKKCRELGATWQQIGDQMGTSRQYVQKRFGT
jgi:hypothetical protein